MSTTVCSPEYAQAQRRLLIDMQIPDWDPGFLRRFDPAATARLARDAGATALMVYFQSHTGLCNWPTRTGQTHAAFADRDVMSELLTEARAQGLVVCAYYSVNFNNWAWERHPDWRLQPSVPAMIGGGLLPRERYGICCLNHPDYRAFVKAQATEILERYPIDAFFYDMVWWMGVCVCPRCRARHEAETGRELPGRIDWLDAAWCEFQAARERWLAEFAGELRDTVRALRPRIPVYHNFAVGLANWTRGLSFDSARAHDFLGGDFYGGRDEQLVVSRLMLNLSEGRPVEFMTTVAANLAEHERLKPAELFRSQCHAATSCGAAFLAILSMDPDGACNPAAVELVRDAFRRRAPFEPELGGEAIEQVGVYFSNASKMSFIDNGLSLDAAPVDNAMDYPHLHAVRGACRILQRAHLPFGVISRRQLRDLDRYDVIVLPNVLRMDDEEVAALRDFVRGGGRVYASRFTSLTSTAGERRSDFMLADVFGCHFDAVETGRNLYLDPAHEPWRRAIAPERALSHWIDARDRTGAVRLADRHEGRVLFTLTLPYGYPSRGSITGRDWASIHCFPPWERTATPTVVEHVFGAGRAIYSAADLESGATGSHDALFLALIRDLLEESPAYTADAHPSVWMTAFDQPQRARRLVCFAADHHEQVALQPFSFRLAAPPQRSFSRLRRLPDRADIGFESAEDGALIARVAEPAEFAMYEALYE